MWFRRASWTLPAVLALSILIWGCGYKFRDMSSSLPPNVKTIAVPIFQNNTNELGLENVFTAAVVSEFNRRRLMPVKSVQSADAILTGVISSIHYSAVSYGANELATERRVRLVVDVRVTDRSSGKPLWVRPGLVYQEAYTVKMGDPNQTQFNKQVAMARIADNLAEKIHDFLFSNF